MPHSSRSRAALRTIRVDASQKHVMIIVCKMQRARKSLTYRDIMIT